MKKAITYLLLFAYGTSILMPVLPYISDKVAHTFWLYQHIATVHYEQGSYHTHYEVAALAKKTNSEKGNTTKQINIASYHIPTSISYNFCINETPISSFGNKNSYKLHTAFLLSDYPPPKA
jgi:hypothetical protein